MPTFNRRPEKPNVPPPLHKLSNELARIGVIYKSLDQLTLPAKSLRVHTPSQIKKIGRSLSVFGFLIPIVIDEVDRVLVGVGRLSAARDLGFTAQVQATVTHLVKWRAEARFRYPPLNAFSQNELLARDTSGKTDCRAGAIARTQLRSLVR